ILMNPIPAEIRTTLQRGIVIPAHPLALNANRKLDERRQRALSRYYIAAGAGGLAVGVHTTQFEIRDPKFGLFRPVLELAAEEMDHAVAATPVSPILGQQREATQASRLLRIAGICGRTGQATKEASLMCELKYHAGLLILAAMNEASDD